MAQVPTVTGISPIEGVPGTKVTIRGENLGYNQDDILGLLICGVDCLMSAEWKSNNKIIARSGGGVGKGDIVVVTVQGGRGTSTVQFKGLQEAMGPLKESAVWVDETIFFNMSFGRKRPLSPSAVLQEDPLGLSTEGNERKELEDDLEDMFPGQSGDLSAVNFRCEWFLLENHLSTSYNDLCAGLKHLQRKVSNQKEGEIAFLKANVGSVLEQVNTLHELKCVFESDIQQYGRRSTDVLEKAICSCKEEANKLFDDVLHRKDRADSTRNAINVLKRFHFLFYLPVHTEKNIQKGDYDVVINDYARAKSLFGDTQVQLFKRFYNEVENKIENLRQILSEQLIKMPTTLEYQKKIIRNLHHLESPGDPAWQCLGAQHSYILHLLLDSRDSFLSRELADHDHGASKGSTGSSAVGVASRNATPAAKYNRIMMSSVGEWQATAPFRVLLVEELCDLLSENFPDMWKLSQAYFGGELLPAAASVDHSKHPECKEMILELLGAFSGIIRGAIIPLTLNPQGLYIKKYHVWPDVSLVEITPWLPQVLRQIRGCYNTLLLLDLPNDALDIIKTLLFDLRIHCLTSLFQQTVDHLCNLHSRENWKLEVDDEDGGYTQLPHICETDIIECAQLVKETVLEGGRREPSLLDHPSISKDIGTLIHNVIVAFAQALRRLTLKDPDELDGESTTVIAATEKPESNETAELPLPGVELQFLITLSNCAYMQRLILPRLTQSLIRAGYPKEEVKDAVDRANHTYNELRETLFDAYLEERIDPVVGMIERSMYIGQFDWAKVRHPPSDVRAYIKEIMLNVSQVHAEVVVVWPGLVCSLISRVVDVVAEEMARLMTCVTSFSQNGALQAHIDLAALNLAFHNYVTPAATSSFQDAIDALPKLNNEAKRTKENVLRSFHTKLRFLLACFLDMDPIPSAMQTLSLI